MNQIFVYIYDRLLLVVDGFIACLSRRKKRGILFVKLDQIGDFVIWLPNARIFREYYQGDKITLIVNPLVADLARTQDVADEIWAIDPKRLRRNLFFRIGVMLKIARRGFSVAIQPTYSRKTYIGDAVVRVSQASQRIGFVGDLSNQTVSEKKVADSWYTRLIAVQVNVISELDRNSVFTSKCINKEYACAQPLIASSDLEQGTKDVGSPYFVVAPGASVVGRQWSIQSFASVAEKLYREKKWIPVLLGSANEVALCKELETELVATGCINLAGSTNLIQMVALIRRAKFVIANESGAIHIAAAVKTPSVCILGGGHYERFVPYPAWVEACAPTPAVCAMACFGCNWRCTQGYLGEGAYPCVRAVDQKMVEERIVSSLVG